MIFFFNLIFMVIFKIGMRIEIKDKLNLFENLVWMIYFGYFFFYMNYLELKR